MLVAVLMDASADENASADADVSLKILTAPVKTADSFSETNKFWDAVFRASQKIGRKGIGI